MRRIVRVCVRGSRTGDVELYGLRVAMRPPPWSSHTVPFAYCFSVPDQAVVTLRQHDRRSPQMSRQQQQP